MKNILVIPPHSVDPDKMKVRLIEIAKGLSTRYKVYLLTWYSSLEHRFLNRAWGCVLDLFKRKRLYKKGSLIMAGIPMLRQPLFLASKFNSFFLKIFLKQEKIDTVLSGSYYLFDIPEKRDFKYILDLADLPAPGFNSYLERFIHRQTKLEAKKADVITVVSNGLLKYVSERYDKQAHLVPNGAYINKLHSVSEKKTEELRRRYGLINKWVIGYIGFIGPWVEIDLLAKAFWKVKKDITNAALMLVGASPYLDAMRKRYADEDIIITGTVKGEAAPYINIFDIGVLAHKKTFYQDLAFHIKLIEYTAARKIVVSTPINEVKQLNFPNIIQTDMNVDAWAEAFKKARQMSWQSKWDKLVEPYDWDNIIHNLYNIIEGLK